MSVGELYIHHHMGIGDHICLNGLVRHTIGNTDYEKYHLFCKNKYREMLKPLYADLESEKSFELLGISDDPQQEVAEANSRSAHASLMRVGFGDYVEKSGISCDEEFYRLADVPYAEKYKSFHIERDLAAEKEVFHDLVPPSSEYIFVHDDEDRGLKIEIQSDMPVIKNDKKYNLFHYIYLLENAKEIHCMESAFRCLIEHIDVSSANIFFHAIRPTPGGKISTVKPWILWQ